MSLFKRTYYPIWLALLFAIGSKALASGHLSSRLDVYLCKSGVNLKWNMVEEKSDRDIVLERSLNGRDFEEIIHVENPNPTASGYEFLETDFDPSPGMRYYRLKTIAADGQEKVSEAVAILIKGGNPEIYESVVLHQDESKWNADQTSEEEALVLLQDPEGNVLYSKFRFIGENDRVLAADLLHEIPPGLYTVSASSKQKYYSARLLVK